MLKLKRQWGDVLFSVATQSVETVEYRVFRRLTWPMRTHTSNLVPVLHANTLASTLWIVFKCMVMVVVRLSLQGVYIAVINIFDLQFSLC